MKYNNLSIARFRVGGRVHLAVCREVGKGHSSSGKQGGAVSCRHYGKRAIVPSFPTDLTQISLA